MTKNTIGGKGHKRAKRHVVETKDIPHKEDGTSDYAIVTDMLGSGRVRVTCLSDNRERLAHIRGSMYKRTWIAREDIVLVSLRDFQDEKCDIIYKYSADEAKVLARRGHLHLKSEDDVDDHELVFEDDDGDIEDAEVDRL